MRIYFDESGNSGCIIPNKNGALYNDEQRYFVLAGVICNSVEDEHNLTERYLNFKNKYQIRGEIKGSDMMKRENNAMLVDFIDNLIDDSHFYVCCYDKIFYLASIITQYFFPRQVMNEDPLFYFTQASALTQEDISIFLKYCECNAIGTEQASLDFCKYVAGFDFKKIDSSLNGYVEMAKLVLSNGEAFDFPLPSGCYVKDDYTHVINLTALGESLLAIKEIYNVNTEEIHIVHDHILEFENEFYDSFIKSKVLLEFKDSKVEGLLQYADNIASVFRKCCTETIKLFLFHNELRGSLCNKLVKTSLLQNLKFDNGISYGEDALFCWRIFLHLKKLVLTNRQLYHYRMNDASISHHSFDDRKFTGHKTWQIITEETSERYPQYLPIAQARYCIEDLFLFRDAAHSQYPFNDKVRVLQSTIIKYRHLLFKMKITSAKIKLYSLFGPYSYWLASKF